MLTRQWRDTQDGIELCFWLSSIQGPVKVLFTHQTSIFFVTNSDHQRAYQLLASNHGLTIKKLALKSFTDEDIYGFYFSSQKHLYQARQLLNQHHITTLEADIKPADRYLMERFITGPVAIHTKQYRIVDGVIEIVNPILKPISYKPAFRVLSLDIETAYDTDEIYSIGLLSDTTEIVLMIGTNASHSLVQYVTNEKELICKFINHVVTIDPDVIVGWNVVNFDLRVLEKRANHFHVPLTIGRHRQKIDWRTSPKNQNHYFALIPGRVVLDGIDLIKSATYRFASYSLENVSNQLLGKGKLIKETNEADYDKLGKAKEIKRLFKENKIELARYNIEDCKLVLEIFQKAELLAFAIERSCLTGLELDRVGGSVAAFEYLYLPHLHRKGYIAPNADQQEPLEGAPGGYVMESKPDLYKHVLVLDYKSLYPSIIRTFKVDPYGKIAANHLLQHQIIPGFRGISFAKDNNILPGIIEKLWAARDEAKKQKNNALSQAIKTIMNSFYGVLGTSGCRLHDPRLTSSITLRSHEILKETRKVIEQQGYEVIYGDTDSVFVWLANINDGKDIDAIGNGLVNTINQYWKTTLRDKYDIQSYLEMEYETHFTRFLMPTIRHSLKGSKKRYAGLTVFNDDNGKSHDHIVFKGLESVRTDSTLLAKELQHELYEMVFHDRPFEDYVRTLVDHILAGEKDNKLVYQKHLRRQLSEYQKNIPPHVQAARKAETRLIAEGKASRYKRGGVIRYIKTVNGPEPVEFLESAIDYQHYIDKQVAPIVDCITCFLGSSFDKITQKQMDMFL